MSGPEEDVSGEAASFGRCNSSSGSSSSADAASASLPVAEDPCSFASPPFFSSLSSSSALMSSALSASLPPASGAASLEGFGTGGSVPASPSPHFWSRPNPSGTSPGPRAAHSCDVIGTKMFIFGGWNGKFALNDLFILDVQSLRWTRVEQDGCSPPEARNNHTTAAVGDRIFVHGGHDGTQWLADLHVLDTTPAHMGRHRGLSWSSPPVSGRRPSARACHSFTRVNEKLYMFGGYDGANCFQDIDILDLDTMAWIQPAVTGEKPQARNAHTMTVVDRKLVLFGGHSGNTHLTDLHVFDTATLTWTKPEISGSPPPGLRGHTANLIGHKIFLFGGYDGKRRTNEIYILDTKARAWVVVSNAACSAVCDNAPPSGRQRHSAALVSNRKLFVFGGFDGNKWLNDLHVLDASRFEEDALNDSAVRQLVENLRSLVNCPDFADVVLVVEGREIHAHKNILAANCAYFKQMFLGSMLESKQSKVVIPGWSYDAYIAMIEFLYTGKLNETRTDVVCEVMGLADHYTLFTLKSYSENVLTALVDTDTVCSLLKSAETYQARNLKRFCLDFVFRHADQIMNTPAFDELEAIPSLVMEIAKMSLVKSRKGGGGSGAGSDSGGVDNEQKRETSSSR
ncbi:kelch repeat protein, putative [Toxoplasma gondii ME49]|uniref:Kelch repeat protein, putative n=1 Tax=Toxoplasma gondii (strain ATCC 50611 / Me49) TaxID=508771 RepID=S8FBJ8_TOXGM|nr:kelch repeat protein, putative [Toxoplasma gondii ME49]EPT31033.1 kelch repeat protein, putative [Toxoplasma gondii ME49]|eukprot:XP_002369261.1 kelch repeat protein, putative [Toxoplasma gondii ME49]